MDMHMCICRRYGQDEAMHWLAGERGALADSTDRQSLVPHPAELETWGGGLHPKQLFSEHRVDGPWALWTHLRPCSTRAPSGFRFARRICCSGCSSAHSNELLEGDWHFPECSRSSAAIRHRLQYPRGDKAHRESAQLELYCGRAVWRASHSVRPLPRARRTFAQRLQQRYHNSPRLF